MREIRMKPIGAVIFVQRQRSLSWAIALLAFVMGCGTTRMTDTQRTATEQLLISNAMDQTVSQLDFRFLAGKHVFLDSQYLENVADRGYLVSSLRQQLLACGCVLQEDRTKALYVVEVRSGGAGTDRHSLLIGVPQMTVPTFLPGQPSQIPEIPLAKKTDQQGVSKIAVFAYNRVTGQRLWQSGTVEAISTARDTWVLGAGPFRKGTILQGTEFAGEQLPIPMLGERSDHDLDSRSPVIPVTAASVWPEPLIPRPRLSALFLPLPGSGPSPVLDVLVQSVLASPGLARDPARDAVSTASERPPAKKEYAGLPETVGSGASKPAPSPALPTNVGGQAETEPLRVLSSGWGFQPDR
jgi:hypothetical protein